MNDEDSTSEQDEQSSIELSLQLQIDQLTAELTEIKRTNQHKKKED